MTAQVEQGALSHPLPFAFGAHQAVGEIVQTGVGAAGVRVRRINMGTG